MQYIATIVGTSLIHSGELDAAIAASDPDFPRIVVDDGLPFEILSVTETAELAYCAAVGIAMTFSWY